MERLRATVQARDEDSYYNRTQRRLVRLKEGKSKFHQNPTEIMRTNASTRGRGARICHLVECFHAVPWLRDEGAALHTKCPHSSVQRYGPRVWRRPRLPRETKEKAETEKAKSSQMHTNQRQEGFELLAKVTRVFHPRIDSVVLQE